MVNFLEPRMYIHPRMNNDSRCLFLILQMRAYVVRIKEGWDVSAPHGDSG